MTDSVSQHGHYALSGLGKQLFEVAKNLPKTFWAFKLALILRKLGMRKDLLVADVEQLGLKLRLYPQSNIGDRVLLFMPKFFEHQELEILRQNLKADSIFVDIGANTGIYSLFAAQHIGAAGGIIAFEPNPDMADRFGFNVDANGLQDRINIQRIGVADKDSTFYLSLPSRNLGGASILFDNSAEKIPIRCRPLLDVLTEQGIEHIDLLKIDIESAEHLALNPFFAQAPRSLFPKLVLIETDDQIDFLAYGYRFITRTRSHNSVYQLEQ